MGSLAAMHDETTLKDNVEEYIRHHIDTHVTSPDETGQAAPIRLVNPEMYEGLFSLALDMFEAGAAWADNTSHRESKSIITNV